MSRNKLFFTGLVVLAIVYVVGLGGNWAEKESDSKNYQKEDDREAAVDQFGGRDSFFYRVEKLLDPLDSFIPKLELIKLATSCSTQGNKILLNPSQPGCTIAIPRSDDRFRKAALSYELGGTGSLTSRGGTATDFRVRPNLRREIAIDPRITVPGALREPASHLKVKFKSHETGEEHAAEPRPGEAYDIVAQSRGGILTLTCTTCASQNRKLAIRVE